VPSSFPGPGPVPVLYVSVTNFPAVQPVSGMVNVGNLPTLQTVGGTVNVGNLPLDTGGAVRVTTAAARQPVTIELVSPPVTLQNAQVPLGIVDTRDFSSISYFPQASGDAGLYAYPYWRWNDDEPFTVVWDLRGTDNGCRSELYFGGSNRVTCRVQGTQLQIAVRSLAFPSSTLTSFWVTLIP